MIVKNQYSSFNVSVKKMIGSLRQYTPADVKVVNILYSCVTVLKEREIWEVLDTAVPQQIQQILLTIL